MAFFRKILVPKRFTLLYMRILYLISDKLKKNKGGNDGLPAEVRVDLEGVRGLISTCETHEIQEKCGAKIHSIFMARDMCSAHLTQRNRCKL